MTAEHEQQLYDNVLSYLKDNSRNKRDFYVALADQILRTTGHVPIVSNIASGAGMCYYAGRLSEAIGVKKLFDHEIDRFSGKGSDTHQILGLASLYLFSHHDNLDARIHDCVDRAIRDATDYLRKPEELDPSLIESMILNLVQNLGKILGVIGADLKDMVPIVEQQFIDYMFHMRGIPDLILEDKKNCKAVVVDWKTGKETPTDIEEAQIICYSLMEARRLGFDRERSIRAVLGDLDGNDVKNVNVVPVIVRPPMLRSVFKPHPALARNPKDVPKQYQQFRKLLCDVCLEAEHLTILITNQEQLTGVKPQECKEEISFDGKTYSGNFLRFKPRQIGSGSPQTQDGFPCKSPDGTPICRLLQPCNFYFGKFEQQDNYDKTMWRIRFGIFDSKERDLLAYRGIHEIFRYRSRDQVVGALKNGQGIRIRVGEVPSISNALKSRIEILRGDYSVVLKADVLDSVAPSENNSNVLIGRRGIRSYENEVAGFRFISVSKPVLITPVDVDDPLLSLGFFGKVESVDIADDNILQYSVRVPSRILNYQMILFSKYLEQRPDLRKNVLMFQVNADLTQMELNALDALHRRLDDEKEAASDRHTVEELQLEQEYIRKEQQDLEAEVERQSLEKLLRDIIDRGTRRRGISR